MSKLKILHLEDSSSDAELVRRVLINGNFDFDRLLIDTKEEFQKALTDFAPDIVLCDHSLPSFNSHEALEILNEANLDIPIILITANVSEEFAVDVIQKGADDYILKDRLQRLPNAIHSALDKYRFKKERQRFIDNLIANEKRFRALVENSSDGMVVLSESGQAQYVSPSVINVLGYSTTECMELNMIALAHPVDVVSLQELKSQTLANPGVSFKGVPIRMAHKDGDWRWIEHDFTNMLHESSIAGIVDNFRDVTDRINSEQTIRESEEKYRSFYENSMDGILLTVTDGDIIAANPAACAIFQMTEAEICQTGRMGLIDKEDPRVATAIEERKLLGKTSAQITCIRKDGSKFPGELTSAVFQDGTGNHRTSMIVRDISARKETEAAVLRAYEEKNIILESIGDAFFAVDDNWVVTYWNKESEKLLKFSRDQIIGKNLWKVFEGDDHNSFHNYYRKALEHNTIENFETFYEKTNCWFDVTAYPSSMGLSVYLKDITERKLSEIRLVELNKDLQNFTNELMLSNTELEQFSYIVSHNLRSPVANIMGLTAEMKDESHSPETREILSDALTTCVNSLNNVIIDLNSILTVKKELIEKKEPVKFSALVEDIQQSIQNLVKTEQVLIETDFEQIDEFHSIKSYLHSIFFNLISNSIKYRQAMSSPRIEIKSKKEPGQLIISFKDNGIGIDLSKKRDQVFGLYKRFHQHVEGKGMGLFMVKTQVETMNGKISIESNVNVGTEITIVFPLR